MNSSVLLLCLLVGVAVALPSGYDGGFGGGFGGGGGGGYGGGGYDYSAPTPYNFDYGVSAGYTNFGHGESSDGYGNVRGSYYVHLPDGRVQKVSYYADATGYHPTVTYEGTAQYPSGGGYGSGGYGSGGYH